MANKHQVIDLHNAHPDWTARQIAERLQCTPEYVTATARRNSLSLGKYRQRLTTSELRRRAKLMLDRADRMEG